MFGVQMDEIDIINRLDIPVRQRRLSFPHKLENIEESSLCIEQDTDMTEYRSILYGQYNNNNSEEGKVNVVFNPSRSMFSLLDNLNGGRIPNLSVSSNHIMEDIRLFSRKPLRQRKISNLCRISEASSDYNELKEDTKDQFNYLKTDAAHEHYIYNKLMSNSGRNRRNSHTVLNREGICDTDENERFKDKFNTYNKYTRIINYDNTESIESICRKDQSATKGATDFKNRYDSIYNNEKSSEYFKDSQGANRVKNTRKLSVDNYITFSRRAYDNRDQKENSITKICDLDGNTDRQNELDNNHVRGDSIKLSNKILDTSRIGNETHSNKNINIFLLQQKDKIYHSSDIDQTALAEKSQHHQRRRQNDSSSKSVTCIRNQNESVHENTDRKENNKRSISHRKQRKLPEIHVLYDTINFNHQTARGTKLTTHSKQVDEAVENEDVGGDETEYNESSTIQASRTGCTNDKYVFSGTRGALRKPSRSRKPSVLTDIQETKATAGSDTSDSILHEREKDIDQKQFEIFEKELKELYNKMETKHDEALLRQESTEIRQDIPERSSSSSSTITLLLKDSEDADELFLLPEQVMDIESRVLLLDLMDFTTDCFSSSATHCVMEDDLNGLCFAPASPTNRTIWLGKPTLVR